MSINNATGDYSTCIADPFFFHRLERNEDLLHGCTVFWSDNHYDRYGQPVAVVYRDQCPWSDRPYAVLSCNGRGRFFHGEYDLTLEQAIKERDRRSTSIKPD